MPLQQPVLSRSGPSPGWGSRLATWTAGFLLFETITGFSAWLLPFSRTNQVFVIAHTVLGVLLFIPASWYIVKHWVHYRNHLTNHVKVFGYLGAITGALCGVSGLVLTWQASLGTLISYAWDLVHILSGIALLVFVVPHIVVIVLRAYRRRDLAGMDDLLGAARSYTGGVLLAAFSLLALALLGVYAHSPVKLVHEFPPDYSFKYGHDRPFAPSQAKTDTGLAFDSRLLSGSQSCGTAGCHEQIVSEWQVSAHRWSAMDIAFQKIQLTMAQQNGPESTRYCGGCHDPISLFSGAKNIFTDPDKLTSLHGYQEGVSCLVCHGIHETDLKGNAHYTVAALDRYLFELEYQEDGSDVYRFLRDFLIRAYPRHHVDTLSKRLFKAPEYCAACHKQFIDEEINNVGWVQLQNQYDNWRKSRWNHPDEPERTIECRECHMPLVESTDPAAGDSLDYNRSPHDGKHRSHRFVASNQLMPRLLKVPGWEEQVALTEKWLKGEFEIPEIADKWSSGPAVSLSLSGPAEASVGEKIPLKAVIVSNKVGHDFPTGPLDIIQAWVELIATDEQGQIIYSTGTVDENGYIAPGSFIFKAEPVDRQGNLIDRHNLWEMVGVRYRRALFPGFSDLAEFSFICPDLHRPEGAGEVSFEPVQEHQLDVTQFGPGEITVRARLLYRKIDQYLLHFVFGKDIALTSPITEMASADLSIRVLERSD